MPPQSKSPRQRLLTDRNWRFAFGHAGDPGKDFGYGPSLGFWKPGGTASGST
jgi:beta-galactosidase